MAFLRWRRPCLPRSLSQESFPSMKQPHALLLRSRRAADPKAGQSLSSTRKLLQLHALIARRSPLATPAISKAAAFASSIPGWIRLAGLIFSFGLRRSNAYLPVVLTSSLFCFSDGRPDQAPLHLRRHDGAQARGRAGGLAGWKVGTVRRGRC